MAKKRLKDFPDVPTTYELGYPVATTTTRGYAVRAGTPPERIEALSNAPFRGFLACEFVELWKLKD